LLLSLVNVSHRFPGRKTLWGTPESYVHALTDVSLELASGEILGVVGESGCGKSTLGRCAVGLIRPEVGTVRWNGEDIFSLEPDSAGKLRSGYQMVFQNPYASLNPRQLVGSMLREAVQQAGSNDGEKEKEDKVNQLTEQVGMSRADLRKYPHQFSGGQRQRLALARVLALNPKMIVLDEPLSSLDVSIQSSILKLLKNINENMGVGYLFISHDLQIVGSLSHRVLVMYLGKIVEEGPTNRVLSQPRHPYTQILLSSSEGKFSGLKGDPPSPTMEPRGCPFSSRCPLSEKKCGETSQDLLIVEKGWKVACWKAI